MSGPKASERTPPSLPSGWAQHGASNGQRYYVNTATGQSTHLHPARFGAAAGPSKAAGRASPPGASAPPPLSGSVPHRAHAHSRQRDLARDRDRDRSLARDRERTKKRSTRLAQSAASTYMTRGAGPALGTDLLKIKLGSGALGPYHSQARRRNDAVTWISGVKVEKHDASSSREDARRPKSLQPRRDKSRPRAQPMSPGGTQRLQQQPPPLGSRGISDQVSGRRYASYYDDNDASDREGGGGGGADHREEDPTLAATTGEFDLQEEVIDVSKQVPMATFEKLDIAKRSCTLSLYGPWAHKQELVFLRLSLRFTDEYPRRVPKFELQHNASVALQTRAFLLRSLRTIMDACATQAQGCMGPCARFLAGSATIELQNGLLLAAPNAPFAEDSSDDESGVDVAESERDDDAAAVPTHQHQPQNIVRMLPGARCGASFGGPNGQLVVFRTVKSASSASSNNPTRDGSTSREATLTPLPPLHLPLPSVAAGGGTATPGAPESNASMTASVKSGGIEHRPAGSRFLYSYAALTRAMDSLMKLGQYPGGRIPPEDQDGRGEEDLHSSRAQLQVPELLSFMSTDFLTRRLQARSTSSRGGPQSSSRAAAAPSPVHHPHHNSNLLSSPLAFTAIDKDKTTTTSTRNVVSEASTPPPTARGRGRDPHLSAAAAVDGELRPPPRGPRSRSLAVGRERQHVTSPLVPYTTLAHPRACSEVKIYTLHVVDLTLRMAGGAGDERGRSAHIHEVGSVSRSAKPSLDRRQGGGGGKERRIGHGGGNDGADSADDDNSHDTDDDDDGDERGPTRPGFWRKRSESSPAASRLRQ